MLYFYIKSLTNLLFFQFPINIPNFVPNESKTVCPKQPQWIRTIQNRLQKQNKIYNRLRNKCFDVI